MAKKEKKSLKELTGFGTGNRLRQGITVVVGLSIAVVLATGGFDDDSSDVASEEEAAPEAEEMATVEEEPEVEEEAQEETPLSALEASAEEHMGEELIDVEYADTTGHGTVYFELGGFSAGLDKSNAHRKVAELLRDINEMEEVESLYAEVLATFTDDYGNEEDREAITYDFSKETIDQINFDNFYADNVPNVADAYWEHPAFND